MKKIYRLFFIVLFITSMQAQTLFTETFEVKKMPPDGWTIEGKKDNWKIENAKFAGGSSYEVRFWYEPTGNGTYRFISPKINTQNKSIIKLTFRHTFLEWNSGEPIKYGIAVKNGSSGWKPVWEVTDKKLKLKELKTIYITDHLNSADFQFCFYFIGNPDHINKWAFDDIKVAYLAKNAKSVSLDLPEYVPANTPFTPKMAVKNVGAETVSFPVTLNIYLNNKKLSSKTLQVTNLQSTALKQLTFDSFTPAKSNELYKVVAYTSLAGDLDKKNDTTIAYVNTYAVPKMVLWESFTNTNCGPCKRTNPINEKVIRANIDKIVPLFLHTSWPSPADPFYVPIKELSKTRTKTYYYIPSVPYVVINGEKRKIYPWQSDKNEKTLIEYVNKEKAKFSPIKMKISGKISGNKFLSKVEIDPMANVIPGTYKLHVGITECNIHYNAQNGEKEFNWVLRNLYPSATGTKLDIIKKGGKIVKNIECTLDPSWKKENLKVIVFVQNDDTKKVIQAAKLVNITSVKEEISNTPEKYSLSQNYPNPFNPSTTIEYQIPEMVNVNLVVYDILGRKVKTLVNKVQNAGNYKITFNAEGIASGIYFYKLTAGDFTNIKKIAYIK